jgi:hypothetical protein
MSRALLITICAASLVGATAQARVKPIKPATATLKTKVSVAKSKPLVEKLHRLTATRPTASARGASAMQGKASAPRPRTATRDLFAKLPATERAQVVQLLTSPRVRTSVEARRAVAAYLVLRTIKGGKGLPLSIADMALLTASKRWSSKRLANLSIVLREAVGIAQAEKVSAGAAFTKALKKYGIYNKYSRGVCPA